MTENEPIKEDLKDMIDKYSAIDFNLHEIEKALTSELNNSEKKVAILQASENILNVLPKEVSGLIISGIKTTKDNQNPDLPQEVWSGDDLLNYYVYMGIELEKLIKNQLDKL